MKISVEEFFALLAEAEQAGRQSAIEAVEVKQDVPDGYALVETAANWVIPASSVPTVAERLRVSGFELEEAFAEVDNT